MKIFVDDAPNEKLESFGQAKGGPFVIDRADVHDPNDKKFSKRVLVKDDMAFIGMNGIENDIVEQWKENTESLGLMMNYNHGEENKYVFRLFIWKENNELHFFLISIEGEFFRERSPNNLPSLDASPITDLIEDCQRASNSRAIVCHNNGHLETSVPNQFMSMLTGAEVRNIPQGQNAPNIFEGVEIYQK